MEAVQGHCSSACMQSVRFGNRPSFSSSIHFNAFFKASQKTRFSSQKALLFQAGRLLETPQKRRDQTFYSSLESRECATNVLLSNAAGKPASFGAPASCATRRRLRTLRVGPDTLTRFGESEETEDSGSEDNEGVEEWWQDSGASGRAPDVNPQFARAVAPADDEFTDLAERPAAESRWDREADDELSEGYSSDEEDFDSGEPPSAALTVLGEGPLGESSDQEGLREGLGEGLEEEWQENRMVDRVWELIERVQAGDEETVKLADIKAIFGFPIDKFQRLAIQAFLEGRSVVCCAPTGSGKTLIAEAAAAAVLARGKRILYTTPLKALSNQKLRDFRDKFGEENVGLVTGDASVNREAPILVMTTEILRNMLYSSVGAPEGFSNKLTNVEAVILDEVHYLSDISRGTVWEETIIYCPPEVRLVCLSATVANAEELADWIAQVHGPTELVTSTRRPVPLTWHFSTRNRLAPLLNETGTAINPRLVPSRNGRLGEGGWDEDSEFPEPRGYRKALRGGNGQVSFRGKGGRFRGRQMEEEDEKDLRRRQIPMLRDTLAQLYERDMLPAIWFIFSRKGCDQAVAKLKEAALLTPPEEEQVRTAVDEFRAKYPDAVREHAVGPLYRGLAAHHAGCLPLWKSFVEELFQRGLIKVVFATETLAAGINMPARTTVLSSLSKRGDNGISLLTSNAMLQMAGRAGRRGIDTKGNVVIVQTPFEDAEACTQLLFAGSDPLVSQFKATYGMALNLLQGASVPVDDVIDEDDVIEDVREQRYVRVGRTLDEARELVERSFGNYVGSEVMVVANRQLAKLEEDLERLEDQKAAFSAFDGEPTLENRLPSVDPADWEALIWWKERLKAEKRKKRALQAQLNEARAAHVLPSLKKPWIRPPVVCIEWAEGSAGLKSISALLVDTVPRPYFLDNRENEEEGPDDDMDDDIEGGGSPRASPLLDRIRGEAGLETGFDDEFAGGDRDGFEEDGMGLSDGFGEVRVDSDDQGRREDSSDDEYDGSYQKTGPHHVFDRALAEGYETGLSATERAASGQLASTSEATWQPSKPDSYYLCLGSDNSWYVVSNRAITSVHPGPKGESPLEPGEDPRGVLKARLKAAGSQNWVNLGGSKVDVWATEGAIETWTWTVQLPTPDSLRPAWTASPAVVAAWERLEAQKKVTAKVRKMVSTTPAFRELRLVKAAQAKLGAQTDRLEHKAARLRQRIASIEPSGWKEFVRVVQVLCQATAIEQPYSALVAENQTARLTPLGELAAAVRGSNELFLAMVFSDPEVANLTTEQIAAVAAAVGAAEDRKRSSSDGLYQSPSKDVLLWMDRVEATRAHLSELQDASGVQIPTDIDLAVAGLAEAWASGVTWKELLEDVRVDEGDIARLLRRTIDLLAQVPFWPHVSKQVKRAAQSAAKVMDRPPISELIG